MLMKVSVTHLSPQASTSICLLLRRIKIIALLPLFIAFLGLPAIAQNKIVVKGHIVDDKNQPVNGASVLIKGTTTGTVTDANGDFEISAPPRGILIISSIGYPAREVSVNGHGTLSL